ncbi:MAG: hypothetical protein ACKVRN_15485 [Pyrinomonadaceae bacterium]
MLSTRGWREVTVRLDQLLHTNYFDFSVATMDELGLDAKRSLPHRGSSEGVTYILNQVPILSNSSIIDIGAGKGRAMFAMAPFPFRKIDGVEISPTLTEIARRNLSRAFLSKRSHVFTSCASVFEDYDDYSYFYFYNPFPTEVLRDVMRHIHSSIRNQPRECRLIYNAALSEEVKETICSNGIFSKELEYAPPGKRLITVYLNARALTS